MWVWEHRQWIKSQIIQSCSSTRLRRRALRESEIDLKQLLLLARSFQISDEQATGIENDAAHVTPWEKLLHENITTNQINLTEEEAIITEEDTEATITEGDTEQTREEIKKKSVVIVEVIPSSRKVSSERKAMQFLWKGRSF